MFHVEHRALPIPSTKRLVTTEEEQQYLERVREARECLRRHRRETGRVEPLDAALLG